MTDLTGKFGTLQQQLATQHTELMGVLNTIAQNTDTIGQSLNVIAADTNELKTLTLGTLEVLDWINTNTRGTDEKMMRVADAIAPVGEELPQDAKTSIAWAIYRIMDATAPSWPRPVSVPLQPNLELIRSYLQQVLGIESEPMEGMWHLLYRMSYAIKAVADDGIYDDSVVKLLSTGAGAGGNGCGCAEPVPGQNGLCENPYIADVISTYEGQNYILWNNTPPSGATVSDPGNGPGGTQLNRNNWNGWKIYIHSNSASIVRYTAASWVWRTNTLITMQGNFPLIIRASEQDDLKVFICPPDGAPDPDPDPDPESGEENISWVQSEYDNPLDSLGGAVVWFATWAVADDNVTLDGITLEIDRGVNAFRPTGADDGKRLQNNTNVRVVWVLWSPQHYDTGFCDAGQTIDLPNQSAMSNRGPLFVYTAVPDSPGGVSGKIMLLPPA